MRTALYTQYLTTSMQAKFAELRHEEAVSLRDELALLRVLADRAVELWQKFAAENKVATEVELMGLVRQFVLEIKGVAATVYQMEVKDSITGHQVEAMFNLITGVLARHLKGDQLMVVGQELQRLPWPNFDLSPSETIGLNSKNNKINGKFGEGAVDVGVSPPAHSPSAPHETNGH